MIPTFPRNPQRDYCYDFQPELSHPEWLNFGEQVAREAPDPDLVEVARIGLAEAERSGPHFIVVVSESLPHRTREALAALRTVVTRGQVPPSETLAMLPGYFYLEHLELSGTRATFAGVSGEVPAVPPGYIQNSCGSGPSLVLEKREGRWVIALGGVMSC